jgi:hypothetical protein
MKQILGKENSSKFIHAPFGCISLIICFVFCSIKEKTNLEKRLSLIRKMCKVANDPRSQMYPMLNCQTGVGNKKFEDEADHCSSSSSSSLSSSSSINYFTSAHRFKCFFKKNHQRFNMNMKSKSGALSSAPHSKRKGIHSNENGHSNGSLLERHVMHRKKLQEQERNEQLKLQRIISNLNRLNRVHLKYSYAEKCSFPSRAVLMKRDKHSNRVHKYQDDKDIGSFSWMILDSNSKHVPKLSNRSSMRSFSLFELSNITTDKRTLEIKRTHKYISDSENYLTLEEELFVNLPSVFTCRTQSLPQVGQIYF